jgi:hypothetical protein
MNYVDLNPVRPGMAETLLESDHTSVQTRLKDRQASRRSRNNLLERPLKPVAGLDSDALMNLTEASYIELVQWTVEQARAGKRGKLKPGDQVSNPPVAIWSLAKHPKQHRQRSRGGLRAGAQDTAREIKDANANYSAEQIEEAVDEALAWARKR